MAFFKFRKDGEEHAAPAPAPESIETLRKRARYRMTGAAILVLAGVIGFPLLFDNQPRPIALNIPIDIPDKAQVKPLAPPLPVAAVAEPQAVASASVAVASEARRAAAPLPPVKSEPKEEVILSGPTLKPSAKGVVAPESKAKSAVPAPASVANAKAAEAAKAQALLDGKPAATDGVRFVVQFGSYSDAAKAHEARMKVERAGLKTYAQMVQGSDGKKYRVRVGPFEHRADAEKAVEKIKKLSLPTAILEI